MAAVTDAITTPMPPPISCVMDHSPKRKRVRDPEAHRAAILGAARAAFAERGYARATIRDIAARAGVTHSLVMRHFTSKEGLFLSVSPSPAMSSRRAPCRGCRPSD